MYLDLMFHTDSIKSDMLSWWWDTREIVTKVHITVAKEKFKNILTAVRYGWGTSIYNLQLIIQKLFIDYLLYVKRHVKR